MLKLPLSLLRKPPAAVPQHDREARLRAGFESAPAGIAFAALDGVWLQFNERFREAIGYSREQLARLTFNDITHPDDARAEAVLVRRLLAGDVPHYRMQKRIIERRGRYREVLVTAGLVHGGAGEPDFFVYVVDEPLRGTAKTPSPEGERTLAHLLDRMTGLAIIRTDEKGVITGWNAGAERMFGYGRAEILGQSRRVLFRDRDNWDRHSTKQLAAAADGATIEIEDWRVARDGRHLWLRANMSRIERDGVLRGYVEVIGEGGRDSAITEQARLSGEVRAQELKQTIDDLRQELSRREDVEESLRCAVNDLRVAGDETMKELRIMTGALRKEMERRKAAEQQLAALTSRRAGQAVESAEHAASPPLEERVAVAPRPRSWKRLDSRTPAELLIAQATEGRSGRLVVVSGKRELEVVFEQGMVFSVSSNDPSHFLTQRLIELSIITEEQRQRALEIQRETHLALGRVLVLLGAISEKQLLEVLCRKAEEEIAQALSWRGAKYAFVEGEVPALQLVPLRIDVAALIVQRLSRHVVEPPLAEELRSIDAELPRIAEELEDIIEIPPPPPPPPPVTDLLFASPNAKRFHRPSCPAARRLDEETRIMFISVADAENGGYEGCRLCFKA